METASDANAVKTIESMAKTQTMTADQHSHDTADKSQAKTARASSWRKLLPVLILIAGLVLAWASGVVDYLSFETLRENRETLQAFVAENPVLSVVAFMASYAIAVALSLPVGSLLTISCSFVSRWRRRVREVHPAIAPVVVNLSNGRP